MSKTIDFSSLTLQDALDLAILVEDEARERYEEFTDQMRSHHCEEAAEFFRFMVANEVKHGEQLLARRQAIYGAAPRRVTRAMLWDVEAPEYNEARAFMKVREVMEIALQAETKAHDFFLGALEYVKEPEVKALFEELCQDELSHKELVKREIAKLPPAGEGDARDYEDEPVSL